jgi:hypothetical protein
MPTFPALEAPGYFRTPLRDWFEPADAKTYLILGYNPWWFYCRLVLSSHLSPPRGSLRCLSISHGLRRGLHSFAALRLIFVPPHFRLFFTRSCNWPGLDRSFALRRMTWWPDDKIVGMTLRATAGWKTDAFLYVQLH